MANRLFGSVAIAAIAVAGCEPATESPPPEPPTEASGEAALDQQRAEDAANLLAAQEDNENIATIQTAKIDWGQANRDFAEQSGGNGESNFSVASAGGPEPSVPILLPSGGPVSVASTGGGPRFKQTADGYYAVYKYENYDVIVNGTNQVIGTRAEGARDEALKFTATAAGGQVALSRYGADYLVEFECYTINPATGTCIEEAEALGVAESLVIRRTRGN